LRPKIKGVVTIHTCHGNPGSFVVGDRPADIEAAAGLPCFLFAGGALGAFLAEILSGQMP
jgi:hypothetical protein